MYRSKNGPPTTFCSKNPNFFQLILLLVHYKPISWSGFEIWILIHQKTLDPDSININPKHWENMMLFLFILSHSFPGLAIALCINTPAILFCHFLFSFLVWEGYEWEQHFQYIDTCPGSASTDLIAFGSNRYPNSKYWKAQYGKEKLVYVLEPNVTWVGMNAVERNLFVLIILQMENFVRFLIPQVNGDNLELFWKIYLWNQFYNLFNFINSKNF